MNVVTLIKVFKRNL